jgi:hypothetical protein
MYLEVKIIRGGVMTTHCLWGLAESSMPGLRSGAFLPIREHQAPRGSSMRRLGLDRHPFERRSGGRPDHAD